MKGEWKKTSVDSTTFGSIVKYGIDSNKLYLYFDTNKLYSISEGWSFIVTKKHISIEQWYVLQLSTHENSSILDFINKVLQDE